MSIRQTIALVAVLTFLAIAVLYGLQIEAGPARIVLTFGAVFGIAVLAGLVARLPGDDNKGSTE